MLRLLLLFTLLLTITLKSQIVVGYYYGNAETYPCDLIEYNCLTHIAHAFIIPDSSGNFRYHKNFLYPELIKTAHDNGKKIVVSIGGWGNSDGFKPMSANRNKRDLFISSLVNFIKVHGYDGADIDWEYPKKEDKENFNKLITEMRTAFDSAGIEILSAALPAIDWNNVFDSSILKNKLTWFGIMTYDFYGPWEPKTGLNTALYSTDGQSLSIDMSIKHWKNKGVPEEKLCIGMEFAGYIFNSKGLYQSHKGGKSISYLNAMEKIIKGWQYNWDDKAKVPYLTRGDSIITIDDSSSIRYKSDYIVKNKLAGTIIWRLGLDYHKNYNEFLNIIGDHFISVKPGIPSLLTPANYELINFSEIKLSWSRPEAAGKYKIEISCQPDFSDIIFSDEVYTQTIEVSLEPYKIYYWRICSENAVGEGGYSDIYSFAAYNKSIPLPFSGIITHNLKSKKGDMAISAAVKDEHTIVNVFNIYCQKTDIYSHRTGNNSIWLEGKNLPEGSYFLLFNDGLSLQGCKIFQHPLY